MAKKTPKSPEIPSVLQIGQAAGIVWRTLDENGPLTLPKLIKAVSEPRDLVLQAIGWLAREDKLLFEGDARHRTVALRNGA